MGSFRPKPVIFFELFQEAGKGHIQDSSQYSIPCSRQEGEGAWVAVLPHQGTRASAQDDARRLHLTSHIGFTPEPRATCPLPGLPPGAAGTSRGAPA